MCDGVDWPSHGRCVKQYVGKYLVAVSLVRYPGCRSFLCGGLVVIRGLNFLYSLQTHFHHTSTHESPNPSTNPLFVTDSAKARSTDCISERVGLVTNKEDAEGSGLSVAVISRMIEIRIDNFIVGCNNYSSRTNTRLLRNAINDSCSLVSACRKRSLASAPSPP